MCNNSVEESLSQQTEQSRQILGWLTNHPKSLDAEAYNQATADALTVVQARRHKCRASAFLDRQESKTGRLTTGNSYR